ncbi:uncharacterized protein UV8b_05046 [Ustilaginoidea virens]|uniref:Uncharacterized protein n=1 Tax=Ustilaginoidea virens TaxID=1159556 RepID=A0A8E5HSZ3_USTVR|nr:uncharacterized protein UV8b_05046 [Ustilaginoidea virens]QUC20805.1 hypothetical protein UV8b_05046 [Ustilaginoidea virens]
MNLTEGQMNKLTDAMTQKVDSSPIKAERAEFIASNSQNSNDCYSDSYVLPQKVYDSNQLRHHQYSDSSPCSELIVEAPSAITDSLAERRKHEAPPGIKITTPKSRFVQAQRGQVLGSGPDDCPGISSPYHQCSLNSGISGSGQFPSGKVNYKIDRSSPGERANNELVDVCTKWTDTPSPHPQRDYPKRQQSLIQKPKRSKSTTETLKRSSMLSHTSAEGLPMNTSPEIPQNLRSRVSPSSQFSPLPLYFRGQSFPSTKAGGKTMVGHNGWLECTGTILEDGKKSQSKRMGFLHSIKRIAKDVTAEINASYRRPNQSETGLTSSQVAISLDAREQSLLYCELEFYLTSSLNEYIVAEFDSGHLVPGHLKKISDFWLSQGRPRVISFRYDLETQLELIALHLNEFRFYGRRQGDRTDILALLHAMKVHARAMRIRTFCQPDSVIAKQLVDSQSLFNMLNAPSSQQLALDEIAHFFKMIVSRERANHATAISRGQSVYPNGRYSGVA